MSGSLKMLRASAVLSICVGIVCLFAGTALAAPGDPTQTVCSDDGIVCATWPSTLLPGSEFTLQSTIRNTSPTSPFTFWLADSVGLTLDQVQHLTAGHSREIKTMLQAPASGCMSVNYYGDFAQPLPTGGGVYLFTAQICV